MVDIMGQMLHKTKYRKLTGKKSVKIEKTILLLTGMVFSGSILAAGSWKLQPLLTVSEAYNDNLTLASTGVKIDDYITTVSPAISVTRDSRKLKFNGRYQAQGLLYGSESQYNTVFHQFQANGTANLIKDIFFINGTGTYSQQNINQTSTVSFDNISITNNRTNVGTARLNPYLKFKLGNTSNLLVSVDKGVVRYGGGLRDSNTTTYNIKLDSGTAFNKLLWNVYYNRNNVKTDFQADTKFEKMGAGVEYKLFRQLALTASGAYEDNTYIRAASTSNPTNQSSWTAGVKWTPSKRTTLEVGMSSNFFSDSGYLRFSNKVRQLKTTLSYLEDVTVLALNQYNSRVFSQFDPSVTNGSAVTSNNIDVSLPGVTGETYIRKRLGGSISFRTRKSLLSASIYDERRLYQSTDTKERVSGGYANLGWKFALRTRLNLSVSAQLQELRGSTRKDGLLQVRLGVTRDMRSNLQGSVSVVHNRRDSNANVNDYNQNTATVSIIWRI